MRRPVALQLHIHTRPGYLRELEPVLSSANVRRRAQQNPIACQVPDEIDATNFLPVAINLYEFSLACVLDCPHLRELICRSNITTPGGQRQYPEAIYTAANIIMAAVITTTVPISNGIRKLNFIRVSPFLIG